MSAAPIPCEKNRDLERLIKDYVETLKIEAHTLGSHGLTEDEFYRGGLFRGAIEKVRGQFAATMRDKWDFASRALNHMEDGGFIVDWESAGEANRHDYIVTLNSGRIAAIELKGCLDGNNTTIFERPPHAQEFVIWSVCTNPGADPRKNAWSGLHTRLSADLVERKQAVDGVIFWDMACGTIGRPCPKLKGSQERAIEIGSLKLPPPCIYILPATIGSPRNNPHPRAQGIQDVQLLQAFHECFQGKDDEINHVDFDVTHAGSAETTRVTRIRRAGQIVKESKPTSIKRK